MLSVLVWSVPVLAALLMAARWALHQGFRAPREVETTDPGAFGLDFREVSLPTVNGKMLFGWLLPAARADAPAVVVMHGWGANAQAMLPLAVPLVRSGLAVLLVDARSHGRSDGDTFSSMPRFAEDVDSAVAWLKTQVPPPAAIALLGHSVGGAAVLLSASRRDDIAAVISLSAFDHPRRVMRTYLERMHLGWPPLVRLICRYVEHVIGHRFDAIAPVATAARIACPVLVGHGADDRLVLPDAARAIHAAAPQARLEILDGTGHEQVPCFDTLGRRLADYLRECLQGKAGAHV